MTADQGAVPAAGWTTRRWLPTRPDAQRGTRFGELPRFAVVGTAGTVLQLGMFVIMASYVNAALAGALSWVVSTVATGLGRFVLLRWWQQHR